MTRNRQGQFVRRDTGTVIRHFDQAPSGFFYPDGNGFGTCIQRVFDQFLDHRSRALDHFTSGDLRSDFGRK